MKIYLISGKARNGKSTVGEFIKEEYENKGKKVCEIGYGSYIKYYAKTYFGWDGKEETKPRSLLQELGTEIIRKKIDPMFHVNRIMEDIKVLSYFYDITVISDVREPIEIITPKEKFDDVVSINVKRTNFESELSEKEQQHFTEIALDSFDDYDYKVLNDGTLDNLKIKVKEIIEKEEVV